MNLKPHIYDLAIDPLLSGLKRSVAGIIPEGASVIDIACGTGSLALEIASLAGQVTGIDLDTSLIDFAKRRAKNRNVLNAEFLVSDAASLEEYTNNQFNVAVTSMAIHQFEESLAISILREMRRIAEKVVVADYNCPKPKGFAGELAYAIEKMAGGDHYRNFKNYMSRGGLVWFAAAAGLNIRPVAVKGYGVFVVAESRS